MSDISNTVVVGRLTKDPIVRDNGSSMGFFVVASNDYYRDKAGLVQETHAYIPCKIFGRWTESLKKHKKGDMVVASGRLRSESWDKQNPNETKLVLICDSIQFVNALSKSNASETGSGENDDAGKPPF